MYLVFNFFVILVRWSSGAVMERPHQIVEVNTSTGRCNILGNLLYIDVILCFYSPCFNTYYSMTCIFLYDLSHC